MHCCCQWSLLIFRGRALISRRGNFKSFESSPNYRRLFSAITQILEELSPPGPQASSGRCEGPARPTGRQPGLLGPAQPPALRPSEPPQSPSQPGRARASRPMPASIPPALLGRYLGNASFRPRLSQSRSGGGRGGPAPRETSQWESAGGGGRSRRCLPAGPGPGGRSPAAVGGELPSGPRARTAAPCPLPPRGSERRKKRRLGSLPDVLFANAQLATAHVSLPGLLALPALPRAPRSL